MSFDVSIGAVDCRYRLPSVTPPRCVNLTGYISPPAGGDRAVVADDAGAGALCAETPYRDGTARVRRTEK